MKTLRVLSLFFMAVFAIVACTEGEEVPTDETTNSGRVRPRNINVPVVPPPGLKNIPAPHIGFWFTLIAEVDAPEIDNRTLQATEVRLRQNFAIVTYNMKGEGVKGAVDIVNVGNRNAITITRTFEFPDADINAAVWMPATNNPNFFIAGQDAEGAFFAVINSTGPADQTITRRRLQGFSAISMDIVGTSLFIATGTHGGLTIVNTNNLTTTFRPYDDMRSVAVMGQNNLAILTSNFIRRYHFDHINMVLTQMANIAIPANYVQVASKADLDKTSTYTFAALNRGGVEIFRNSDLTLVDRLARPNTPSGLDPEDFVSNSVSANFTGAGNTLEGLVFAANGGAGIAVSKYHRTQTDRFVEYGYFDFGRPISTNFVKSSQDLIFIATGKGGLKILSFFEVEACDSWSNQIAFAGSINRQSGAWRAFDANNSNPQSIFVQDESNQINHASVTFLNGRLTINLGPYARLQDITNPVRIQGFTSLPTTRPTTFTTYQGDALQVDIPGQFSHFVIQLHLQICNN